MSYRLREKSLAREVHRIAQEELEGTLKELLTVSEQGRSTAVHEARKHLKKLRALIRLFRPATGKAFYKRENAAMREVAQQMSSIRDSHVREQTIKKLIAKSGKGRAPAAFTRVEAAMAARLRQVVEESEQNDWRKKTASGTEGALCRVNNWPLKDTTTRSLRSGLKARLARRPGAPWRLPGSKRPMQIYTSCERALRICGTMCGCSAASDQHKSKH
jgi:CHAD domain-containing protein